MIYVHCDQGSDEWKAARCGVITASMFATARKRYARSSTKGGRPGQFQETALVYHFRTAIERISGKPLDDGYETWAMERGHELEPEARRAHEIAAGELVQRVGFCLTDDRRFGCSLDGIIGEDGASEYKAFIAPDKLMRFHIDEELGDVYDQVQGGLWVTGRKWMDVCVYCPALAPCGRELWWRRVQRDEKFIEELEADMVEVLRSVDYLEKKLRTPMGAADLSTLFPFPSKEAA